MRFDTNKVDQMKPPFLHYCTRLSLIVNEATGNLVLSALAGGLIETVETATGTLGWEKCLFRVVRATLKPKKAPGV